MTSARRRAISNLPNTAIWYVLAMDGEDLIGMWTFVPHNGVCWEVHTYLLPKHGFRRGREAARQMAEWIWRNTPCRRIITVPRFNRVALEFARDAGMEEFAVNPRSFQKNGILHDQVLLGLSRPERETCVGVSGWEQNPSTRHPGDPVT